LAVLQLLWKERHRKAYARECPKKTEAAYDSGQPRNLENFLLQTLHESGPRFLITGACEQERCACHQGKTGMPIHFAHF